MPRPLTLDGSERVSRLSAGATVFACTISGGLLTLPSVFSSVALLPAILLISVAALTTFCSLFALVLVAQLDPRVKGYGSLASSLFSDTNTLAGPAIDGTIGVFLTGVVGSSLIVVRDCAQQELSSKLAATGVTAGVGLLVLLLALPAEMGKFAVVANLSTAAFCFLVCTLVYYGGTEANVTSGVQWWPRAASAGDELQALGRAAPVLFYTFGCQFQVFAIFCSVGQQGRAGLAHFAPVLGGAVLTMTALFSLTGVFGVLAFPGTAIAGDVLTMLGAKGTLGQLARFVLVLACVLAAPLIVHPARAGWASVLRRVTGASTDSPTVLGFPARVAVTLLTVGLSTLLAISGLDFLLIVSAMGAFLCSPLFFILPGTVLLLKLRCTAPRGEHLQASLVGGEGRGVLELSPAEHTSGMALAIWLVCVGLLTLVLAIGLFVEQHS